MMLLSLWVQSQPPHRKAKRRMMLVSQKPNLSRFARGKCTEFNNKLHYLLFNLNHHLDKYI